MAIQVIWADKAQGDLKNIIEYLLSEWSAKEANAFLNRIEFVLALIRRNPKIFKEINRKKKIRQCVLMPQVSLYYTKQADKIYILRLFDNRQNPKKLYLK